MKQFFLVTALVATVPTTIFADPAEMEADLFFGGQIIFLNETCEVEHIRLGGYIERLYIGQELVATIDLSSRPGILTDQLNQMLFVDIDEQSTGEVVDDIFDFLDEIARRHGFSEGFSSLEYVVCT